MFIVIIAVAIISLALGFYISLLAQVRKMLRTASLLVLMLLQDYECKLRGEVIVDTIINRSMGLIQLTPDQLLLIIRAQCNNGFIREANDAATWRDTEFELTDKGKHHLTQAIRELSGE